MSVCCCSLAGTAACKTCHNNPDADLSKVKSNTVTSTGKWTPIENFMKNPNIVEHNDYYPTIDRNDYEFDYNSGKFTTAKQIILCSNCDGKLEGWETYCPHCGTKINDSSIPKMRTDIVLTSMPPKHYWICGNCGSDIGFDKQNNYCGSCGKKIDWSILNED